MRTSTIPSYKNCPMPLLQFSSPKIHSHNPGTRGKFASLLNIVYVRRIVTAIIWFIVRIGCQMIVSMHS